MADAARQLVLAASAAGLLPRVTSTYRSRAEQTRLYRRSLQGLQPYYVAPPGSSAHELGWAFDMVVSPFSALADVGYTWQQWGGGWSETDPVHFELLGASAEARRLAGESEPSSSLLPGGLNYADLLSIFYPLYGVDMPVAAEKAKIETWADKFLKSYGR